MDDDVAEAIVRFVTDKAPSIDHLDISWFGGEPLINLRPLRAIARRLQGICAAQNIELSGFMSTNGLLLTSALLAELVELGITRYQITFDGARKTHDKQRLAANSHPTFTPIWNNVCAYRALPLEFEIVVRVHVRPDTTDSVAELLEQLRNEVGEDDRYKITIAPVSHWGGPNDHVIPVFRDARGALGSLRSRIGPRNRYAEGNEVCTAADPGHLVIRPNGDVVKCAHSLDLPENQVGHLTREGRLVYRPGSIDPWIRGLISGDARELACPRDGIERLHSPRSLLRWSAEVPNKPPEPTL